MWPQSRVSTDRTFHEIGGLPLYPHRYDEVLSFHEPGLAPARKGALWLHITEAGTPAYSDRFDCAYGFYENLAAVQQAGHWFHIRPDGTPAYPQRYSWCGNFQEGRATVALNPREYGHILGTGQLSYPQKYRYAGDYREGAAVVVTPSGAMIHIDTLGRPVNGIEFLDLGPFHKSIATALEGGGWHHIRRDGQGLYQVRFRAVEPFYNGRARAVDLAGRIVVIDQTGRVVSIVRDISSSV